MKHKRLLCISCLLAILLMGCNFPSSEGTSQAGEAIQGPENACGDGKCLPPENAARCPQDCQSSEMVGKLTPGVLPTTEEITGGEIPERPVVYLGIMVHLEGWNDHIDQDKFERHAELVRDYAELFERHGGKLTLESKELTDGSIKWGDNVLSELEARGHGIGVHADIGGQLDYDCADFVGDLRRERIQLEKLGVQVRHVSGNTSHCDWVQATIRAGYDFTTGNVAYSVMSLPVEDRPEQYRDCPGPRECHDTFPETLEDRLHPWRTSNGRDWLKHDPEGELVILPSSQVLPCMAEELQGQGFRQCTFDEQDLELFIRELEAAIALAEPSKLNQFYVAWSLGSPLDEGLTERWLQSIVPYVERGEVIWATLPEIYDAYLDWEQGS